MVKGEAAMGGIGKCKFRDWATQSVQWHQWGSKRVIRRRVSALTTFFVTSVQAPLLMSFPVQG